MTKEKILNYPKVGKPFGIHIDTSDTQLGAAISQDGKSLIFYSRKLNCTQRNHTPTD